MVSLFRPAGYLQMWPGLTPPTFHLFPYHDSQIFPIQPTLIFPLAMPPSLSLPVHPILLLAPLIVASTTSPCYYPDCSYRPYDSLRFLEQTQSFCCGQGHSCMSNGLCRWPDADMPAPLACVRGSCTDQECETILKNLRFMRHHWSISNGVTEIFRAQQRLSSTLREWYVSRLSNS